MVSRPLYDIWSAMVKKFSVLYDFEAKDDGELSITAQETVESLSVRDNLFNSTDDTGEDGWILVERRDGATGFVPLQYLRPLGIINAVDGRGDDLEFDVASGDSRNDRHDNDFSSRQWEVDSDAAVTTLEVARSYPSVRNRNVFASYRQLEGVGILEAAHSAGSFDEIRAKIEVGS